MTINGTALPRHINLTIEHNRHRINYESIEDYSDESRGQFDWVSAAEYDSARLKQSIWVVTWHPDTPVGSISYAASDLDVLLNHIKDMV